MHTLLHSVPPTLQQATASPRLHQRLLDTHRQVWAVSCGATAPFSWVLVCTRFCLCPPRVCFPVLCKFWQHYVGVNGDLLQDGFCHTQVWCTQSPCPGGRPLLTCTSAGDTQTFKGRSASVSGFFWCAQGCLWPLQASLAVMGFDSKCDFTPPTVLLGFLLCPWTWGIFFWWDPTFFCWWLFHSEL